MAIEIQYRKVRRADLDAAGGSPKFVLVGQMTKGKEAISAFVVLAGDQWLLGMSSGPFLLNLKEELGKTILPRDLGRLAHFAIPASVALDRVGAWIVERNPGFQIEIA